MNMTRAFICINCEKTFGLPLVILPEWDGKCLLCGSVHWIEMYDRNPNAPQGGRITEVAYPCKQILIGLVAGVTKQDVENFKKRLGLEG